SGHSRHDTPGAPQHGPITGWTNESHTRRSRVADSLRKRQFWTYKERKDESTCSAAFLKRHVGLAVDQASGEPRPLPAPIAIERSRPYGRVLAPRLAELNPR